MKRIHKEQRGLTLLELLIALPIAALIIAAVTGAIIQLLESSQASNHMIALRQVQTAGYWVSKDGLQAQRVNITTPTAILVLEWSGSSKQLKRTEAVNGTVRTSIIATDLVPEETSCNWTSDEKQAFTFKVTAKVGDQTESRIYEITPRPLS